MMTVEGCCKQMTSALNMYRKGIFNEREMLTVIANVAATMAAETTAELAKILTRREATVTSGGKISLAALKFNTTPMGERVTANAGQVYVLGNGNVEEISVPAGAILHVRDGEGVPPGMIVAQW
jgi:UDP-N-acetyl-D-mannosaminuronic acid transferase (WecB/TagA/CpsF family)